MQRELLRQKLLTRRAAILAGGQAALFGGLVERLYQLQIVDSSQYRLLADENRISLRLIAPPRGRILDRFGTPLADNHPNYRAVIVREAAGDIPATLDAVAKLVALDDGDRRRILRDLREHHPFVPVVLRENLSWDEMARIEVAIPELPGVSIEQGLTRAYPMGQTASHALGYVAAVAERDLNGDPLLELPDFRIGKSGIEKSADEALRGTAGTRQVEVNAFGRVVRELTRNEAKPGADVVSSIDKAMQDFATNRCAQEQSVASVLLDALTGDVLALVSHPGFDPQVFSTGLSQADWQSLSTDQRHPLVDKAIAGVYPPGSTFKPVVAAAALSAGVLTPQTTIFCPGFVRLGNATFHCWRPGGHGSIRLHDAIKRSCDVFFYETAMRLGIDRLAEVARGFGYGSPLGLDIPGERGGLIPDRDWKLRTTGVAWQKGETLIAGIGQGEVLATPLQIATMVARMVTGRAIIPRLVRPDGIMAQGGDQYAPDFADLGIDPKVRALVLDGMNAVCNEQGGTAYAARIKEPGFEMGGKSGTSQVHRLTVREHEGREDNIPWKDRDHSLFVAFAPVAAPRYVCATVVEHGGFGSDVCAPICRDILLEVQRRDPARRVPAGAAVAAVAPPAPKARGT
jgi:penicillin-binding protein 2